MSSNLL